MPRLLPVFALVLMVSSQALAEDQHAGRLRGALLTARMASAARLSELRGQEYNAIVLALDDDSPENLQADR